MHSADWVGQSELSLSWLKGCLCIDQPLPRTEGVKLVMLERFGDEGREAREWIRFGYRIIRGQQSIDSHGVTRQILLDTIPWQQVPAANEHERKMTPWR